MRFASPAAFRTGLEARLLDQSREAGVSLGRLRRGVVFERLLARLTRSGDEGRATQYRTQVPEANP